MDKKRKGQEIITFYAPEELKEKYKRVCSIKGTSMTENLVAHMEKEVEENEDLLEIIEKKLEER